MHKFGWTFWISECGTHITAYVTLIAPSNIFRFPPEQLKDAFGWGILCVFVNVVTFYFYSGVCNVLNITFKHLLWTLAQTKQIYIYTFYTISIEKHFATRLSHFNGVFLSTTMTVTVTVCVHVYIFDLLLYNLRTKWSHIKCHRFRYTKCIYIYLRWVQNLHRSFTRQLKSV